MARPQLPPFVQFDTAFQHTGTGEMFVPRSDGQPGLVPTDWFFERVTQGQPRIDNLEGPRDLTVLITPWAFATQRTAERVLEALKEIAPRDIQLSVQSGDKNTRFPYSHDQLMIRAKRGQYKTRINAGLLASNIARSTATVDGVVKQFPGPAVQAASDELLRELDRQEQADK